MDIPGMNIKTMSDVELANKIAAIYQRLDMASMMASQEALNQLLMFAEALQFEASERLWKKEWEREQKKQPKVFDTDPGETKSAVAKPGTKTDTRIKPSILQRSKTPTNGDQQ